MTLCVVLNKNSFIHSNSIEYLCTRYFYLCRGCVSELNVKISFYGACVVVGEENQQANKQNRYILC